MSDFNPDAYLAAKGADVDSAAPAAAPVSPDSVQMNQFDPDQYLAQKGSANADALQAKYGSGVQQLEAGALGAARGVSLGTSDLALTKSGLVSPETLSGLQAANPTSSNVGQIAGGAALIAGTGGAGALAEGAGTAARLGAMALEGGAFGAGNAVSDYAMGDPSLNAQKILSYVGTGAAFGAGLGALGKITEAYLPAAAAKLQDSLGKLRDSVIGDAENPGMVAKVAPDWAQKFYDGMATGNLDPKDSIRGLVKNLFDIHASAKQAANDLYEVAAPANIGEALKDMPVEQAQGIAQQTVDKIKSLVTSVPEEGAEPVSSLGAGPTKIIGDRLETLNSDLTNAKTSLDVHNALSDFATELDKGKLIKFDTMPTAAQMADQDVLGNIRNAIRGDLKDNALWGDAATHYTELSANYTAYKNSLRNFQSSFMKREIAPNGAKRFVVDPTKVQGFFNNFDKVGQDLRKGYLNDFIDQSTNLAKASENYAGFIKGADAISDHVGQLASKNQELAGVADSLASRPKGSASMGIGKELLGGTIAHSMGVPSPLVAGATAALEAYKAIKNPYQTGATLSNTLNKLKGIGNIVDKTTNMISQSAKSIFTNNGTRGAISSIAGLTSGSYEKNVKRIQQLSTDPQGLADHLAKTTEALYEAAPNIVQGMHNSMVAGVQFLNSKIPRPNNELPMGQEWEPTKSQKAQFNRYFAAVDDPVSLLKQVKDGTLSNEAIQAVQAVHPQLLQEMQQKVIENINPKTAKSLNYSTKIAVSKLLGTPMDDSLIPQVIMADQATYAMPPGQQPMGAPKRKHSTLGGLEKLNLSQRSSTETEDLEDED